MSFSRRSTAQNRGRCQPQSSEYRLSAPGDASVIAIPDFAGAFSGHRHTGHLIGLPDGFTIGGSTYNYNQSTSLLPTIVMRGGQGSTATTTANNTWPTFKSAMTSGQLPACIVVFPNLIDPDDSVEGWGMDCADGSFPLEKMMRYDLALWLQQHTRAHGTISQLAECGFSKGAFEVLRMRAKYGASHAACYVVMAGPRLDADLGGAAQTYNSFSAAEKAKIFGSSSALCQAQSPFSSTAGTGLFNTLGANAGGLGSAPLLMIESDPGDATASASMNNAINTRLPAVPVTFTTINVDNAGFTPTHNIAQYFAAWVAEGTNNLSWIKTNAGWT